MLEPPRAPDTARAALAWISLRTAGTHLVDLTIGSTGAGETTARLVGLLRRFPLMVLELQRQHDGRPPMAVADEYDVQDLLRSVLNLHFRRGPARTVDAELWRTQARIDVLLRARAHRCRGEEDAKLAAKVAKFLDEQGIADVEELVRRYLRRS